MSTRLVPEIRVFRHLHDLTWGRIWVSVCLCHWMKRTFQKQIVSIPPKSLCVHSRICVGPTLIKLIFGRACSCLKPKDILSRLTIKENSSLRGMNDVAYIPIDSILCEISVHIERQAYQQSIVKFLQRHRFRYMPRRGKGTDFDNFCEGSMSDTPIKYIQLNKTFFKKLQTYAHRVDIGMYHVYHSHHHRHQIIQISNIESY